MISMSLRFVGTRALLMHHGRLADPDNEVARALRALRRRPQTEAVRAEAQKLEWLGGLYRGPQGNLVIMEDQVLSAGIEGARFIRREREMRAAVMGESPFWPLEHEGPKDIEQLFSARKFRDVRAVHTPRGRIMRTRPRFDDWAVSPTLLVDENVLDPRDVVAAFESAGSLVGLGDFRPRYGRFHVELM